MCCMPLKHQENVTTLAPLLPTQHPSSSTSKVGLCIWISCKYSSWFLLLFIVLWLSCVWLCNPMDYSMSGFPVLHCLPEFVQTPVHSVGDAIQPPHPLWSLSPLALNLSQHQGLFQWVGYLQQVAKGLKLQLEHQSVFPVNIQDWFPLRLTVFFFLSEEAGFKKLILKYIQRWKPPVWGLSHRTLDEAFGGLL